jgi:Ca2+-binding RTX toxin-like protein
MKAELRRSWRRPAVIAALTVAALGVAPAAALANSSVTYSSGVVTVNGDTNDNDFDVTFASSSGHTVIDFEDTSGDTINPPGSGICAGDGVGGVICAADDSNPLNSVVINGNDGWDQVFTNAAPSGFPLTFNGGVGNDTLVAGPEEDTFNGGDGDDDADYENMTGPVNVSADGVAGDGEAGEADNIGTDVEEIDGTDQNDTLTATSSVPPDCSLRCTELIGNGGNDTLNGGSGPDYLEGDSGNDTLNGNAGQDILNADQGADDIHGGADLDEINYDDEPYFGAVNPSVSVSIDDVANDGMTGQDGPGTDGAGAAADNVHSDVEVVFGTDGNDTLTGSAGFNELDGGWGNDTIDGRGGSDFLIGDIGDDAIQARDNAPDVIECDAGNDTVTSDDIDVVSECETNNVAAATLPVQTVTVPGTPKARLNPARVTLGSLKGSVKRKALLGHGVSFTLSANQSVTYDAELTGTYRGGHVAKVGDIVLAARALKSSGRKTKVTLKLNRHTRRAIGRKAKLKLTVVAINGDGNISTVTRTIRVK